MLLYNGTAPSTAKSAQIDFLPSERKIRVSAYDPDTQYDTDQACVVTIDSENLVVPEAWQGRPATLSTPYRYPSDLAPAPSSRAASRR